MKNRRFSSSRDSFSRRSSGRRGGKPTGLVLLRSLFIVSLFVCLGTLTLFSLRIGLSARLMPLFRWLPDSARGLAEHSALQDVKKRRLRELLAETPADYAPMSHLLATHAFAFDSKRDPLQRAQDAMTLLARANARQTIALVPGDDALLSIVENVDDLTGTHFRRDVLILLPGERIRFSFPSRTANSQKLEMGLELRLGCMAATADRLDAPAKGTLTLATPLTTTPATTPASTTAISEERSFEVSPRGEKSLVTLEGRAGESVSLHWPSTSPGFLVVEGWRDKGVPLPSRAARSRGLVVFTLDSVSGTDMSAALLPKTHAALRDAYGEGNTAEFQRVMPDSVDAKGAVDSFFEAFESPAGMTPRVLVAASAQGLTPVERVSPDAPFTQPHESLFTLATKAGLPAFVTRIQPSDQPFSAAENTGSTESMPKPEDTNVTPSSIVWKRGREGRPLASVTFPRRGEIRNAVKEALSAQDLERPVFAHVNLRFPDDALAPTWETARQWGFSALPGRILAGLAHSLGIPADRAASRAEKASQIDDSLSQFLAERTLDAKHDFALVVLRRDAKGDVRERLPAPPDPGVLWFSSPSWKGNAPRVEALTALGDLKAAFALSLHGKWGGDDENGTSTGEIGSQATISRLQALASKESPHTVTEGPEGTWHLFPYGKILVPRDIRRPSSSLTSLEARSVWDIPLDKAREARKVMQERKNALKEHVVHFFFPPSGIQESVSASLQWPLDPLFCSEINSPKMEGSAGKTSPARGVVEKAEKTDRGLSGGYRIWLTAVADPQRGAHLACAFSGNARPNADVEMHFERGSQSLALTRVGLGEFALPLPEGQEGVQLFQTRYETLSGLLGADFAPFWTAFEGYGVYLWEDPNPRLALSGETPLALRRKDKETEEQKRLEEETRASGARFAEERP